MFAFLTAFGRTLPCPLCSDHFLEMLGRDVPSHNAEPLSCRHNFASWTVDVHNEVNTRLKKEVVPYDRVSETFGETDASLCRPPKEDAAAAGGGGGGEGVGGGGGGPSVAVAYSVSGVVVAILVVGMAVVAVRSTRGRRAVTS